MPKLVHSDFDISTLQFNPPIKNSNAIGMGAKTVGEVLIQFGESDNPCCIVSENIGNQALKVNVTGDMVNWFEHLDKHIIDYVFQNTEEWFGKKLDLNDISRMSAPLLTIDNEIILKMSKKTRCFIDDGSDVYKRVDLNYITEEHIIVPVVSFNGIFIASRHFTPSFTVEDILIVGKREIENNQVPFSLLQSHENEDIVDPFSYYTKDAGSSQGSFETHIFANNK